MHFQMEIIKIFAIFSLLSTFTSPASSSSSSSSSSRSSGREKLLDCIVLNSNNPTSFLHNPNTTSYTSILESSIQNLRFTAPTFPRPQFIITPTHESQIQAAVLCSKKHGLKIKVRSGGHDFEGLSYTSDDGPFLMIDLVNLRAVNVSIQDNTAWVQAGATLGEVYYRIAEKSPIHGFPAGMCPTVGAGGHISGAGYGTMLRKHGVSADHVVDARIIDVSGKILDRKAMGEDLFWAIRGGGAASFGVIVAWKINLVQVPAIVTVSMMDRTTEQGATELVHKWQSITSKLPNELYLGVRLSVVNSSTSNDQIKRTVESEFLVLFLGNSEKLLTIMEEKFPELGMKKEDCREMSWIESVISFAGLPNVTSSEVLLNRTSTPKVTFKGKSDYVKTPIPINGWRGIWKRMLEEDDSEILMSPWGGKMDEISEQELPLAHRAGNLFLINYMTYWNEDEVADASEKHISWMRELYDYMGGYVSHSPRTAFLNFKDLDLGRNNYRNGTVSYSEARVWGEKYFKGNFERLVHVKSKVDPEDFFRNEQSIPAIPSKIGRKMRY